MRSSPDLEKETKRAELEADIHAFVKRGGKIKFIPSGIRTDAPTMSYNGPTTCKN